MAKPSMLAQLTAVPLDRPCEEPWDQMQGSDKIRHCARCERRVYDLSEMSAFEAELHLLNAGDDAPCIRYARDARGQVVHAPPLRASAPPFQPGRTLAMASALGVMLAQPSPASAGGKKKAAAPAPDACVVFTQSDADAPVIAAAGTPGPAPAAAPPAAAAAPAAARPAAPAAAPPLPRPEERLGGAPPPIQQRVQFGMLALKSKVARDVLVGGVALRAPLTQFRFTPGDFVADVTDPGGKHRKIKFAIAVDETTTIDLDGRGSPTRTPNTPTPTPK